jgi:molybdate transport system substrate-binding protein
MGSAIDPRLHVLCAVLAVGCSRSHAGNGAGGDAHKDEPLRVAAASDLAGAFDEIRAAFERSSGKKVEMTFGSTGLLAKQIAEGAPFDVFAAANISFVDDVVKAGACDAATKALYARGRIVVWTEDPSALPGDLRDLAAPRYRKIAIANPEHAPYGRAAQEALMKAGVWAALEPRTVRGENVQQTLVYARTGNTDAAIVALSLAIGEGGAYLPIDPSLHDPLDQALVVCDGGPAGQAGRAAKRSDALAFVAFVASEEGRAVMRRRGFLLPGESPPAK